MKFSKRLTCLLFLFVGIAFATAQPMLQFSESGYKTVMQRAKSAHKPVFFMIHASWCPHCMKMKSEVFTDPEVVRFLQENFICAWQDVDQGEGEMLKKKFAVKAFPTFVFLDEKENVLYKINGEFKADALLAEARNALDPQKQLPYLEKQFLADPGNAEKCLAYLTTLKKGSDRKDLSPFAAKYLATQTDAQLASEINWRIIANAVTDIESREFRYVLQHQQDFYRVASAVRVNRKIGNIVTELLYPFTENLDTLGYKKQRAVAQTIGLKKSDSLIFTYDLSIAERTQNWPAYKGAAKNSVSKYVWDSASILKEISQNYLLHFTDSESLTDALDWARQSLALKDSYDGNLLAAKLYLKLNDRKSAAAYAQKAKDYRAAMGWNPAQEPIFTELGIQ